MKNLKLLLILCVLIMNNYGIQAQDSKFKLFEKSNQTSGFGGLTLNALQGKYLMLGGEGAAMFGNFYLGGFGFSGTIGNYSDQLSDIQYELTRSSGGLILGGVSNSKQIIALYGDLRLAWDTYTSEPVDSGSILRPIEYSGFSLIPTAGIALRPITWVQLKMGFGFNYSGVVNDGAIANVPYNAAMLNLNLTFGAF